MARILIAGCGDVGTRLGNLLAQEGHTVWGLKRTTASLPAGITPVAADLTDARTLAEAIPEAPDWVFHAAAPGERLPERYRAVYHDGVVNLLAALRTRGAAPQRIVFVSSTAVYAQNGGEWVDETSPATGAGSTTAPWLRAAEDTVLSGPFPATVVRLAGIYGPGRTRLIERALRGSPCRRDPPLYTNRIHVQDCARLLAHLSTLPELADLYLGVDDAPAPEWEVMSWLAERLGSAPPEPVDAAPDAPRNKRCSNRRIRASGFDLAWPDYRAGYGALVRDWLKDQNESPAKS